MSGSVTQRTIEAICPTSNFHDSIPYIDTTSPSDDIRAEMDLLLKEEMSKATKKLSSWQDEVNARAPAFTFSSTRLFGADLKLLEESNGKLPSRVDHRAKYKVTLPSEESEDVVQIKESLDQARLAVVLESNRVTDLELLSKYNVSLWDLAFQRTSYMKASIDEELKTIKAASDTVNRRRKQEHTQAASTLQQLGEQYDKNVAEQYVISARKVALEASVIKMRKIVTEKGIGAITTATASR